jgi:hypothetical protein
MAGQPAEASTSETAVKAAFLPKFARYVTWPPNARPGPGQTLQLCTIGGDPFGQLLDHAAISQSADGRRITVRRVASAAAADNCHVVFVSGRSGQPAGQILAALGNRPVLTVTDARSSRERGIIHFAVVGGRVRFFVDNVAAAQRQLAISSRLLELAVAVRS